ncbi:MAG: methylated-DNA--[protein]-cysteine S-methyltransferase [Candidatus Dormibacteraceae bacterium]
MHAQPPTPLFPSLGRFGATDPRRWRDVETVAIGPVGRGYHAAATNLGICRLAFPADRAPDLHGWVARRMPSAHRLPSSPFLARLDLELVEYLDGSRTGFTVPVDSRGTLFQEAAWTALEQIPYGQTRTYGQLAAAIGRPAAVRAVGAANGANPVPLLRPCHRVIGSDGSMTGFGGGLDLKLQLLRLEGALLPL